MSLVKKSNWSSPFSNTFLTDFFNTDNFFNGDFNAAERMPAVNILENEKTFSLEVAVPGMKKDDFKVEVQDGMLSIVAEREDEKEEVRKNYTRKEFSRESFSRLFTLPDNIMDGKIDAEYKNGILYINIPKKEVSVINKKKVEIK